MRLVMGLRPFFTSSALVETSWQCIQANITEMWTPKKKNMCNVSPLEGTVKFYFLDCEPFRSDLLPCFYRSVYLLCTYRNASNNHPGHLLNLSIFYLALIRFHIKFGEDRKDN